MDEQDFRKLRPGEIYYGFDLGDKFFRKFVVEKNDTTKLYIINIYGCHSRVTIYTIISLKMDKTWV